MRGACPLKYFDGNHVFSRKMGPIAAILFQKRSEFVQKLENYKKVNYFDLKYHGTTLLSAKSQRKRPLITRSKYILVDRNVYVITTIAQDLQSIFHLILRHHTIKDYFLKGNKNIFIYLVFGSKNFQIIYSCFDKCISDFFNIWE